MKAILTLFLLLSSLASARTTFKLRDLPQATYLQKKIDHYTRTPEEIKRAQLLTHDAVKEIIFEARRFKVDFPNARFFQIDMKENKILFVCLEVSGPNLRRIPPEMLAQRPAGKFLSIEYEGLPEEAQFGKEISPYLEKLNLKVLDWRAFQYKESAIPFSGVKEFLLPVVPK